ncbi:MAG TPA: hypothetical protein PLO61_08300, partial [Fimbriimonadaceae bacterium]|nr:hypothetical protein [Fimbriimonadaceae bacterium]HRJ33597.1 hypothetical protein [Fimbriimonadaceae bacterium]
MTAFAAVATAAFAGPIGGNRVLVLQVGADDRTASVTSAATEQFVNEFDKSPLSARIQQLALPTAISGANRRATQSGTATSVGHINLSTNGAYLTFTGYDAAVGTAGVTSSAVTSVNRVIGRIELSSGMIDTTTFLDAQYNGDNFRDAVTVDGTAYWTSGNSSPATTGGTWHVSHGDPTASGAFRTQINNVPSNTRKVNIFNGDLYLASGSGNFRGVNSFGTGLPTVATVPTLLPGFEVEFLPTNLNASQYDFHLEGNDTIYIVDDRNSGTAVSRRGIQKWKLISGVWTYLYSIQHPTNTLFRTLAVETIAPGIVRLYTVTGELTVNSVVYIDDVITDTSNTNSFVTLQTAPTFTVFRGVELTPDTGGASSVTGTVDFGQLTAAYNTGANLPTSIPVSFRDGGNSEIAT